MVRARENAFASCPAATGEMGCTSFPDGAHRCSMARAHVRKMDRAHVRKDIAPDHQCACSAVWSCTMSPSPSNGAVPTIVLSDPPDSAAFARGVKTALEEIRRKGYR